MSQTDLFYRFGIALVIGLLIGLERQRAAAQPRDELFAGVRTFPLFALTGCLAALLADHMSSPWPLVIAFLVLGLLVVAAYWHLAQQREVGMTTEVAALVTFLVGALCYWNYLALASAIGVTTMLLLSLRLEMHRFARQITQEDVYATLKFAVISAIVLPILPNQSFGPPPLDVLNPYRIWLMVVLISGISFLGYVLMKLVDARQGIGLTGLLGGLASSTAVTLSFAERSRQHDELAGAFALGIIMAWTVMFVRVLATVAALNRSLLGVLWPALAASALAALAYAAYLYWTRRPDQQESVQIANPFSLGPAVKFGLLYALILLITRTAELYFGQSGIYLSALIAGVADVDAITLSMAELSRSGAPGGGGPLGAALAVAANAVLLAILSNTLVKTGIVFATGSPQLRPALLPGVVLIILAAGVTVFLVARYFPFV
jgi:uncharacterized membrane protein (DUF4010 family)